jgi:hypothetical protein
MAFEDAVILCQCLVKIMTPAETPSQQDIEKAIQEFENL